MAQTYINEAKFQSIAEQPSVQRMLDELDDKEFERFVEYIFQWAGYSVEFTAPLREGDGLDMKVYVGPVGAGTLKAGVQVKQWAKANKIPAEKVILLRGGLPEGPEVVGFFVTTTTFNPGALARAKLSPRIWPIDGTHFVRYITYVRGSHLRLAANADPGSSLAAYAAQPISPAALFTADDIVRRSPDVTTVLTLANHKGGVGKTTTALNLAFGLSGRQHKQNVLLIDMDPQANTTRTLTRSRLEYGDGPAVTLVDYFANSRSLTDIVWKTPFDRLWLIPSAHDLTLADIGLSAGPEAELRFVRDLHSVEVRIPGQADAQPFDWIIIDTGPSMGFFTRTSIAASHYVLLPVSPSAFADIGLDLVRRTIGTMEALIGDPITLLGSVVTNWKNDAIDTELLRQVRSRVQVFKPEIPFDRNGIEAAHIQTAQGRTRFLDRRGRAAKAYAALLEEVLTHVNKHGHTVTSSTTSANGATSAQAAGN
jgi:chromosome partitioning protein